MDGEDITATEVVASALTGAAGGAGGQALGKTVSKTVDKFSPHAKGRLGENITCAKNLAHGYVDTGKAVVPTGELTPTWRQANVITGKTKVVESKVQQSTTIQKPESSTIQPQG